LAGITGLQVNMDYRMRESNDDALAFGWAVCAFSQWLCFPLGALDKADLGVLCR